MNKNDSRDDSNKGRIIIVRRENKILTLLFKDQKLISADAHEQNDSLIGSVYVGKVKNVLKNINAAFVEYEAGKLCFLPQKECTNLIMTNRVNDEKLVAGDEVVIQIQTEGLRTKEPGATGNISFSGKYCVITTGRKQIGFSSNLSKEKKNQLKTLIDHRSDLNDICSVFGIVFRTNCNAAADDSVIADEIIRLAEEAKQLLSIANHRTCFSVLKKAFPSYIKGLQDFYQSEFEEIVTDDAVIYEELKTYLAKYQPEDSDKLRLYDDNDYSLMKLYSIESKLQEALSRKVWMKSGAYLVIDRTEALTCIDVNSGKNISKKDAEEMYFQCNIEAAQEIGRQLRLRNLSGIIIIDFVNMKSDEHNLQLMQELKRVLAKDPVKTDVVDMTPLGLVEVTRKKGKATLEKQLSWSND